MPTRVTSVLKGRDGKPILQWEKPGGEELLAAILDAVQSIPSQARRSSARSAGTAAPLSTTKDMLSSYCIGDAHMGMYSWEEETGTDFDLKIAERLMCDAMDRLVAVGPDSAECLIANLGDYFHSNDQTNATPQSRNQLDVDGRFLKVLQVGVRSLRYLIERALDKHKLVRVRNVQGNHDPQSSLVLTLALGALYDQEPRVIVEQSPAPLWWMTFGQNLIGLTHGDGIRAEKLPSVLAQEAAEHWHLPFRYIYHGHIHQKRMIEDGGVIVESFRTLAGRDAWHATKGYKSGREMQCIVLHKDWGETERHTVSLGYLLRDKRKRSRKRKTSAKKG